MHLRLGFVFSLVILLSMMALREMYSKGIKPMSYMARLRKPWGLKPIAALSCKAGPQPLRYSLHA